MSDPQKKREKLSAFVITFNEEEQIQACLESLSFCDEIIVVDSFSTDNTVCIAERLGARVVQRAWPGYRQQKEFGLSLTSHEWVLNIDADERVSESLRDSVLATLDSMQAGPRSNDSLAGYYLCRVVFFLGRWWRRGGWYPEYRLRFFRKSKVTWGGTDPHERVVATGPTSVLSGEILHFTYKNLDQQIAQLQRFSSVGAREEHKLGRRFSLFPLLVSPVARFVKFYLLKQGFREGVAGFVVAINESYYAFCKYAKLWELDRVDADLSAWRELAVSQSRSQAQSLSPQSKNLAGN